MVIKRRSTRSGNFFGRGDAVKCFLSEGSTQLFSDGYEHTPTDSEHKHPTDTDPDGPTHDPERSALSLPGGVGRPRFTKHSKKILIQ